MAHSITRAILRFLVLALFSVALPSRAAEMPDWFAETLLDARQEAADAAKQCKRLVLFFWLSGCPYCERMTEVTFRDPAVLERFKRGFSPAGVNVRGDRDIVWTDGTTYSEKQLTATLKVRGTPTILVLDEKGAVVLRLVGYVGPAAFLRALDSLSTAPKAGRRSASPN